MAEVTVIGWVVSPIIKIVIDKAQSYRGSQYKGVTGARGELARLASTLTQIQTVVAAVERRPAKDPNQAAWLRQLRDAVYEAEDVLDDFDYELLEARVGSTGGKVSSLASSSIKIGKRLIGTDECSNKLREILKKLDDINATTETLLHVVKLDVSTENLRPKISREQVTSSLLTEVKVFGREKERDEILGLLLKPVKGSGDRSIPVLPIVGVGGVGKTTLAQLVYNDRRVEEYFELRMWVCVSDRFDEISITREILQSATDEKHVDEVVNFDKLQKTLKRMLLSKKFLLVLDDVRNDEERKNWENKERWRKLLAPLQFGESGSRILVTTRMEMVAEMLDSMGPVFLKGLARDEYWLLFKKCAFGSEEFSGYPELQAIGREIAVRLNGSPLAAKAVGGRLKHNLDIKEWKTILEREVWDDIMPVLISSYQNLPVHLQRCFAYCSIFPKAWRFKSKKLVNLWIAQDFIRPGDTMERRMEDVGRDCFDDLLSRSFFQTLKQGYRTYYVIHDLMHDLAQSVSMDECCRIEGDGFNRRIPPTVRHISVTTNHLDQLKNISCELKNLRTVMVFKKSEFNVDRFQDDILRELKGVRALDLTGCDLEELQEDIGQLTHLRYLALCGTLKTLPESVSKLYHLQVLNLPRKCRLGSFPKDMSKLVSLRHLNIDGECVSMIAGIGKLTCLQGSLEFHVKNQRGQNIGELKDMKELQGQLTIKNLDDVKSKEEAAEADLLNKKHIKKLWLEWDSCRRTCRPIVDAEVLEGLRPNPSLKELHITRYQGASSPSWMETKWLWTLKSICLTNCRRWEVLPPLGQLPFLKVLHIKEMSAVRQVGYEFYGIGEVKGFPSLRELQFDDMPEWVEWSGAADSQLFPRLRSLKISNCPKLMKLPPAPLAINFTIECVGLVSHLKLCRLHSSSSITFTLSTSSIMILHEGLLHRGHLRATKALNIRCSEDPVSVEGLREFISLRKLQIFQSYLMDKSLSTCLQELKSLSTLEIVDCPNVTSLPSPKELSHLTTLQELCVKGCQVLTSLIGLQALPSLERLTIERCPKLTSKSLPTDMRSLSSLKKLSIMYCPQLQSLPENGLPTSIKLLCLIGCHPALTKQLCEKEGPEWDKVAHVPKLIIR